MSYTFLEDIALADIAFLATGETLEELFNAAGLAVTNVMVRTLSKVDERVTREFALESIDVETLLFNFMQELIYLKDVDLLLFCRYEISINPSSHGYSLKAKAYGEGIDMKKHDLIVDVKAVTMHRFEVRRTEKGWQATVILDI